MSADVGFDTLNVVCSEETPLELGLAESIQDLGLFCDIWTEESLRENLQILGMDLPEHPSMELLLLCTSFLEGDACCSSQIDLNQLVQLREMGNRSLSWTARRDLDESIQACRGGRHSAHTYKLMQERGLQGRSVVEPVEESSEMEIQHWTFEVSKNEPLPELSSD